jgi:non-ribosomal peptide synthetase component F
MQKVYPLTSNDVILQKTNCSFDLSVLELVWWAIKGASVCMLKQDAEKSPGIIAYTIATFKVTVMYLVPSTLNVLLDYLESDETRLNQLKELKQLFTGGESLRINQVERFNKLFPNIS